MGKNYFVDEYERERRGEWRKFGSLKKAVRYARKHGLHPSFILDKEGNSVPDLDLDDPKWMTHRELENALLHEKDSRATLNTNLAHQQDAYRNRQITMIRAGYIPTEILIDRITNLEVDHHGSRMGPPDATVTITLAGIPGEIASQYNRRPFTAFLEALQDGIKNR
jgi:hypothetical protein